MRCWLTPALLVLLFSGCTDPGPEAAFSTYLARLERPLAAAAPAWETAPPPRPPRAAKLRLALAPGRLDALDFLSLRGCELQVTVGKRNSSLGRLAPPSQELLLELEFLRLAPACIEHLENDNRNALATRLHEAVDSKRQALPSRIYNATLATDEFRGLWSAPQSLGSYPASTSSAPVSALEAINAHAARWLAGDYSIDNRHFELLLGEVAKGDAGALLAALSLQQAGLGGANAMLRERGDAGGLCTGTSISREMTIFKKVVETFFIGGIQPWSATVNQRLHDLLPPLQALETQLADRLPPAYREWQQLRENRLRSGSDAPRQHVKQIQRLLEGCAPSTLQTPL